MPEDISRNAQNLIGKMLNYKNDERVTLKDIVDHEWFQPAAQLKPAKVDKQVLNKLKKHRRKTLMTNTVISHMIDQLAPYQTKDLRA